MLTELFLNSCFSLILNKKAKIKRNKVLYRDILDILDFYQDKEKNEIPITIQTKLECIYKICELKIEDKTDDNIIDSISYGQKFKSILDFIELKRDEEISETEITDNICQVRMRKKLNGVVGNYKDLSDFLDIIKSGKFDSIDDVIFNYEKIIKEANFNLMESSRSSGIESSSTLDLAKDDYSSVIDMIKKKYDKSNTIKTGYSVFDKEVFDNGGFEKSRLYIFGGGSGSGKSTLMLNFINNDLTMKNLRDDETTNESNVYVYLTLENLVDESLIRLYQMMFEKDITATLRDINSGVNFKKEIYKKIKTNNDTIIFKYFPKFSISCTDIMMNLDDVIDQYGKNSIRGLYVDYLDLLRPDVSKYDLYRLELGFITSGLKDIAVKYNIPVITASQLGRAVYANKDSKGLNLDMMSESVKKIEHADFISLMSKDLTMDEVVHLKIGKNRCGKSNTSLDFKVNFAHYKFLNGTKVVNDKKTDSITYNDISSFEKFEIEEDNIIAKGVAKNKAFDIGGYYAETGPM